MIKYALGVLIFFLSPNHFACSDALPTNDVNFCSSFKAVAICYCKASGLPSGMCQDMEALYTRMVVVYGSLQLACERQKHTSTQNCLDTWNCYRRGGVDSNNQSCSSTGLACQ